MITKFMWELTGLHGGKSPVQLDHITIIANINSEKMNNF